MDNEIAIDETSKMTSQPKQSLTGLGERLKKARESMHLTQKEAAARLYLNPKIVEIIEDEAFFEGPPMTFMRGYIRSYAKLLNVPESDVKATIDNLELVISPSTPTAPPILQSNPTYRGDRYIRWITYLIVLILISLVVLWWGSNSKYSITEIPTPIAPTANPVTEAAPSAIATPPVTQVTPTATEPQTPTTTPISTKEKTVTKTTIETKSPVAPAPAPITDNATTVSTEQEPPQPETSQPAASTSNNVMTPEDSLLPTSTPNISTMVSPEEKPAPKSKKKHRRHQYRPIENMEIPEPD